MLISLVPLLVSIWYAIYVPPMNIQNTLEYERFVKTILSDTTGNFHSDFDSVFTFNGNCVGYTFKHKHECHE